MAEPQNGRVAVYFDFDNIVLSWYDRVHGRNSFGRDRQRIHEHPEDAEIAARLQAAVIDVAAIIDYASSFGTLVLTRAYADWSSPVNADYRSQLVARAVDLVQLFPAAAYAKNGADIRLAVDAVEDMFRLDDLTHVVIVAGDSDYVPLAQRCKRLGRYVVGIGVAGSTAKALTAACDEFASYDALPGIERPERPRRSERSGRRERIEPVERAVRDEEPDAPEPVVQPDAPESVEQAVQPERESAPKRQRRIRTAAAAKGQEPEQATQPERIPVGPSEELVDDEPKGVFDTIDDEETEMTGLLIRALWLSQEKDDSGWLHSSAVKQQMRRMDPSFNEKALGFRSFSDFLKSRSDVAELEETGHERLVRLKDPTS